MKHEKDKHAPYLSQRTSPLQTRSCENCETILARNPVVCCPIFKKQETINHEQRNACTACLVSVVAGPSRSKSIIGYHIISIWYHSFINSRAFATATRGFHKLHPSVSCWKSWNNMRQLMFTVKIYNPNPFIRHSPLKLSKALGALHRIAWDVFWPCWSAPKLELSYCCDRVVDVTWCNSVVWQIRTVTKHWGHSIILDLYAGYDHIELRDTRVACNETRFTLAWLQLSSYVTMLFSSLVKRLKGPFVNGIGETGTKHFVKSWIWSFQIRKREHNTAFAFLIPDIWLSQHCLPHHLCGLPYKPHSLADSSPLPRLFSK